MPRKMFKPFEAKFRKKAKAATKAAMINRLIKEYYETTLEEARRQPKHFGEDSSLAEEDPRSMATKYTADYRDALTKKDRVTLEYLFLHLLQDEETSSQVQDPG